MPGGQPQQLPKVEGGKAQPFQSAPNVAAARKTAAEEFEQFQNATEADLIDLIQSKYAGVAKVRPDLIAKAALLYAKCKLRPWNEDIQFQAFTDTKIEGGTNFSMVITQDAVFYYASEVRKDISFDLEVDPPQACTNPKNGKPDVLYRGWIEVTHLASGKTDKIRHWIYESEYNNGNFLWRDADKGGKPLHMGAKVLKVQLMMLGLGMTDVSDIEMLTSAPLSEAKPQRELTTQVVQKPRQLPAPEVVEQVEVFEQPEIEHLPVMNAEAVLVQPSE